MAKKNVFGTAVSFLGSVQRYVCEIRGEQRSSYLLQRASRILFGWEYENAVHEDIIGKPDAGLEPNDRIAENYPLNVIPQNGPHTH